MNEYRKKVDELLMEGNIKEAIDFLENYCKANPEEIHAKFDCALFLQNNTIYADGYLDSLDLLREILEIDPFNINAVVLNAFIEFIEMGIISEFSIKKIQECLNFKNEDIIFKQLYVLKALYFYKQDKNEEYITALNESIHIDPEASYNNYLQGERLRAKGEASNAIKYFRKALANVKVIYSVTDTISHIDFNEYVNEHLRGTSISGVNYEALLEAASIEQ